VIYYTVPQSGLCIELHKLRYRGKGYTKYWIKYYNKANGTFVAEERNVKITDKVKSWWEVYDRLL
jgi:hypothetical protein